jgi:hypothetical protein
MVHQQPVSERYVGHGRAISVSRAYIVDHIGGYCGLIKKMGRMTLIYRDIYTAKIDPRH